MIAIDIGSNSLRILQIDCNSLKKIFEYEKIVRTAHNLNKAGKISDEAIDRIIEAIKEAQEKIDFSKDKVKAVATAAFRKALNKDEVLKKIKEKTEVEVEIIDSDMEGYYSAVAVEYRLERLKIDSESFLLADIGGGSVEMVLKHKKEIITKSFDFGIVTIAQTYKTKEKILNGIRKYLEDIKIFLQDVYQIAKPKRFVSTGGTPATIAAIKHRLDFKSYNPKLINGTVLFEVDIDSALKKLTALNDKERAKLVGVGREDLIIAGVLILKELMIAAGFDEILVSDDGVREGVALIGCKSG